MVGARSRTPVVLVVEDESLVAMLAQDVLEDAGCLVSVARDGASALTFAASGRFDVAVVDLGLPDLSGTALLDRLRAAAPGLRLIVSTGYDLSSARPGFALPTGVAVLVKPWDPTRLVAEVMRGARAPEGPAR
jgi:CheY-like chemotaxis protein